MKKYFRMELRIGEENKYYTDYTENENTLFLSVLYSGTGVISIDKHTLEGYIANDYIIGEIGNEYVAIIVFNYNNQEELCFEIQIKREDFELPGHYLLKCSDYEDEYATLNIMNQIKKENFALLQGDIDNAKKLCSDIFLI